MASADPQELQRDVVALTTAVLAGDVDALRAVLEPYFAPLDPHASAPVAGLLTACARKLGDAYSYIAETEGVTVEQLMEVAGLKSQ